MTRARAGAILLALLVCASGLAFWVSHREPAAPPPRPANQRPVLLLLTSLPLVFGEEFSVTGNGSPVLGRLEARYRTVPISVASPAELAKGRLLLMAQPLAQPAEDLVALDSWVRGGGRVMLLADPMLEWPSERPLGDLTRPPPMFMDTGLLAHWGLRLDAPDQRGSKHEELGGFRVLADSPGALSGECPTSSDGFVARCRIGRGRAIVVADADFLDVEQMGSGGAHNLDGLLSGLASLEAE